MALNKAKILKSAEKYVVQGKISHAISEYQKLIREDPTDLPLVNTLGDLYVRIGNIPEAVKCFTRLAESYDNGGFVVRSIAMYKKVSKIDPNQVHALARLADLYMRQGLISDARSHYVQLAEHFLKRGEFESAADVLQKILENDPDNPLVDVRLAEIYERLGKVDQAAGAYHSASQKFRKKGSLAEAETHLKKALESNPGNLRISLSYAEVLSELAKADQALSHLRQIQFHELNPEVLEASFQIYLKSGRLEDAEKTAAHLMELDTSYFRLYLSLADYCAGRQDFDAAVKHVSSILGTAVEKKQAQRVEAQLKSILQRDPEHVPALLELVKFYNLTGGTHDLPSLLEKVGSIFVRRDELVEASGIFAQLVRLEPSNPAHRESLKQIKERLGDRGKDIELPRLVPDMTSIAEKFVSEPTLKTISASEDGLSVGLAEETETEQEKYNQVRGFVVEGDLFAGYGLYAKAIDQYKKAVEVIPSHLEVHEKMRDMYAKGGELQKAAQECLVLANIYASRNDSENANRNFTLAYQYDPDLHQEPIPPADSSVANTQLAPQPSFHSGEAVSREVDQSRLNGLLEEVDFYFEQGFLTEAKDCIDEYCQLAPSDPEIVRRQERYQRLLAEQSDEGRHSDVMDAVAVERAESAQDARQRVESEVFDTAVDVSSATLELQEQVERPSRFELPSVSDSSSLAEPEAVGTSKAAESFDEMMIDLDRELESSTLENPANLVLSGSTLETSDPGNAVGKVAGLDDVFAEFKAGLEEDNESHDYETHYNLGIAFREMGLLEEAIGEFQKALIAQTQEANGEEFVKCCNMLGLCFIEKNLPQVAAKWFAKALANPGQDEETYQALRYHLACAYEQAGNIRAALESFLDVYGVNINYRDVAEKIESLKKSL